MNRLIAAAVVGALIGAGVMVLLWAILVRPVSCDDAISAYGDAETAYAQALTTAPADDVNVLKSRVTDAYADYIVACR